MQCLIPIAALALGALSCAASPLPRSAFDPRRAEHDIAAVLDDWHDAAAHADEPRYFGHLAPDAVFIGTDATERWTVPAFRAYAHPHFARGRAWTFHATERHIVIRDSGIAWFDERLATERLGDARGSGVLARGSDGVWRIEQYVLSITVPNERFDAVRSAIDVAQASAPPASAMPSNAPEDTGVCMPTIVPPALERYDTIAPGLRFSLDLAQDNRGAWVPTRVPAMPLHHASTIVWTNPELLAAFTGRAVRVIAIGIGRASIEHDARRATWFATYSARIERVCPLP